MISLHTSRLYVLPERACTSMSTTASTCPMWFLCLLWLLDDLYEALFTLCCLITRLFCLKVPPFCAGFSYLKTVEPMPSNNLLYGSRTQEAIISSNAQNTITSTRRRPASQMRGVQNH